MTTKTADLTNLSADDLAAELARREQEATERQAEADAAEKARQDDRALDIIGRHVDLDTQLQERGKEYGEAFERAVRDRDLPAAFAAWVNERATREARRHIRNEATNAETRLNTGRRILPELRYYAPDLLERLQASGETSARDLGADLADSLLGGE